MDKLINWDFLKRKSQSPNIAALEDAVNTLIRMTEQKNAGQRGDGNLPWEMLDVVKWTIICEAAALVLSGELEKLKGEEE